MGRMDQVQAEVEGALDFMKTVYTVFGMTYELELSTRPKKACGLETAAGVAKWDAAEQALADSLNSFAGKGKWKYNPGDGAFYGPKIDIKVYDVMGRRHQCATIQLDFQLPINFDLKFKTNEEAGAAKEEKGEVALQEGEKPLPAGFDRPVMVHRAMLGSVERMMAVLIEHFQGKWPLWLSPRQVMVVPVHQEQYGYAEEVAEMLKKKGYYAEFDDGAPTFNAKIRNAQLAQWNFILVVGADEQEKRAVNVRTREMAKNDWSKGLMSIDECFAFFDEIVEKKCLSLHRLVQLQAPSLPAEGRKAVVKAKRVAVKAKRVRKRVM